MKRQAKLEEKRNESATYCRVVVSALVAGIGGIVGGVPVGNGGGDGY